MEIKIKRNHKGSLKRFRISGNLKEIMIKEDIIDPEKETISLCFRGNGASGIVDLTKKEAEELSEALKNRIDLVKDIRRFP